MCHASVLVRSSRDDGDNNEVLRIEVTKMLLQHTLETLKQSDAVQ